MKLLCCIVALVFIAELSLAQTTELAQQHGLLTADCRAIRGHSKRIVEEASQPDLNTSVAVAHLGEVIKSLTSMEKRLQGTKKLLSAGRLKLVASDYTALEKICVKLKNLAEQLEKEFAKGDADRFLVRKLASDLRSGMTDGSQIHEQVKSKLGVK